MFDAISRIDPRIPEGSRAWWDQAVRRVQQEGGTRLATVFPALARRVGRAALPPEVESREGRIVDWEVWRACDLAALALLEICEVEDEVLIDLYEHGDLEERTMVLRALSCLPISDATKRFLEEAQRTNTQIHFEAAVCDSNLAVRAREHPGHSVEDLNRLILKLAFLDLPMARVFGVETCANEDLSRMLQGLASEREAAGRTVWKDTCRLLARAPTAGSVARIIGGLEQGSDEHRLAAAEGLSTLGRTDLLEFALDRLDREPHAIIRAALEDYIQTASNSGA